MGQEKKERESMELLRQRLRDEKGHSGHSRQFTMLGEQEGRQERRQEKQAKNSRSKSLKVMWRNLDCVLRVMTHNQKGEEWRKGVACSFGDV